jgi:hypothetical protein
MATQPTSPPVTFCFDAWCQSGSKISIIDPIYDRRFKSAPVFFHVLLFLMYPLSVLGMGSVKLSDRQYRSPQYPFTWQISGVVVVTKRRPVFD